MGMFTHVLHMYTCMYHCLQGFTTDHMHEAEKVEMPYELSGMTTSVLEVPEVCAYFLISQCIYFLFMLPARLLVSMTEYRGV